VIAAGSNGKRRNTDMKLIRLNMGDGEISIEDVPEEYAGLGGRGFTSTMINADVPPKCDPLGPDNKLVIAPGLLSGTSLPNTSRISLGAKSPLTGTIKESNVGGTVAHALGRLGITAIVIEGQPAKGDLHLLRIDENGQPGLVPAEEYRGMGTYELVGKLLERYGKKTSVLCIGPAGERKLKVASVQSSDTDGHPCRAAGRGGLGAVMGAKGIKAVVVDQRGNSPYPIADPDAFKEATKAIVEAVKADHMCAEVMPKLGTAGLVAPVNSMGAFPSYNARKGVLDGWQKISGEAMADLIKERGGNPTHMGCSQCMIHCSNRFVDEDGEFVTGSLEYETIWSMGGMTGVADLDTIARLDNMCDDLGIDTMSTGVAIAVAMDAGHADFGDGEAVIGMVQEIAEGTEFGDILGSGPAAVGKHFNHDRVPVVKGQSVAAYDPRAMLGHGVTFATCPMGADHTAGNLVGAYLEQVLDPLKPEGQVETSRFLQITMAAYDTMGVCFMASVALLSPDCAAAFRKVIEARLGTKLEPDDFPQDLGIRVLETEKEFNRKAGFTKEDDRLPEFYYKEPLPPHNTVFVISDEEIDSTLDF
jgi:aldehyde:ferredoxin oxidoreductase